METTIPSLIGFWNYWLWPVLLFVIGLGLVVFVHELGHFLVARWTGVKLSSALRGGPKGVMKKHARCGFETDAMFSLIRGVLFFVPFKAHRYT